MSGKEDLVVENQFVKFDDEEPATTEIDVHENSENNSTFVVIRNKNEDGGPVREMVDGNQDSQKDEAPSKDEDKVVENNTAGEDINNDEGKGIRDPPDKNDKIDKEKSMKSVILLSSKDSVQEHDVNKHYNRKRRYDNAGEYRIGPTFVTASRLYDMEKNKPGRLSVNMDPNINGDNLEFGLLTYLWTFTDQHNKQEIDLKFLKSLMDSGVDINSRDGNGQTILHAIVRDWHPDVALFAIRYNADVNAQDDWGRSPLHLASALNNCEMVRLLLRNGSKVNMPTFKQLQTPLHYAAKYNSLGALKILMKWQGSIIKRDHRNCTPLYLACERGSAETVEFLLDLGVPIGVYDNQGVSALTCLIERLPGVAYNALQQFQVDDISLKQSQIYLSHLECDGSSKSKDTRRFAGTPLELITAYNDIDLIMHPVIQKCIEVKWKLFGKGDTMKRLLLTFLYLVCWLVLAYTYSDSGEYYHTNTEPKNWSRHSWKIVFEVFIIIFALYFFLKEFYIKKEGIVHHQRQREWKQHLTRLHLSFCHPGWPGEGKAVETELERIQTIPALAGKQKFWFAYELMILLTLATTVVLRIVAMNFGVEKRLFITTKVFFTINMVFSFVRVLKICLRFKYFSVFLKVAGLAVPTLVQIGFLYLQLYIPFVAVFWLLFGGDAGKMMMMKSNFTEILVNEKYDHHTQEHWSIFFSRLQYIFYFIYESSFGQETLYIYERVDEVAAQILTSLYHIFVTFITFSIFIAFVTSQFTTNYKRCVAEASLLQASVVLEVEKSLNKKDQQTVRKYYKRFCAPLVTSFEAKSEDVREKNEMEKLVAAGRAVMNAEREIRYAEDRAVKNCRRNQREVYNSVVQYCLNFRKKQGESQENITSALGDIIQTQNQTNKYLSKLFR